ncbi:MAG: phosphate ABC transporter permease PstA [Planctomycetes bacterium]|nr:phosphate ABC transporter permease PstA [Planctomycetota bacterium]
MPDATPPAARASDRAAALAPGAARPRPPGGRAFIWLCGGALGFNLLLVLSQLLLIAWNGLGYFWPRELVAFERGAEGTLLGEVHAREQYRPAGIDPATLAGDLPWRIQLKIANRELTGTDFLWLDEREVTATRRPADAVHVERLEWGAFHGFLRDVRRGDELLAAGDAAWPRFLALVEEKRVQRDALLELERGAVGDVNHELEELRLERRRPDAAARATELDARQATLDAQFLELTSRLDAMRTTLAAESARFVTADGKEQLLEIGAIVHALRPNELSTLDRLALWASRLFAFLLEEPRESNTEGGIFPALFGTVMMVFLMSVAVVPLGVLAALYLREYARQGALVRVVRIAVNNLAGVPSIVFGVFGLGFFVYGVGGTLDQWFHAEALPQPTFGTGGILWAALTLALLTVPVVIVATEEGLAAVPRAVREGSLALGATKFETTWRVVLPAAAPGMLTGVILAIARAAGEVAPLMIVGMVKLAPALPIDHHAPFIHLDRKFMHLGFHIYDVGFQSPNAEATKPLVFATALVLLVLVVAMNLVAIRLRNQLRQRYASSAV